MRPASELLTAADRIKWAIDMSGKTLVALANEVGCSHAALSHWANGKTDSEHIKAMLLQRFADATGVEARWLLTGDGPVRSIYTRTHPSLVVVAAEVARRDGDSASTAERMLRALLPG